MRFPELPLVDPGSYYAPSYDLVIAMQSQYRDPPPYPGHSKQLHNQPGLRQSFSGSETSTDVSVSSTENLATSQRQEPQGEENESQKCLYNQLDLNAATAGHSDYSILARLGMPTTNMDLQSTPAYLITGPTQGKMYTVHSDTSTAYTQGHLTVPHWQQHVTTTSQHQQVQISREQSPNLAYRTVPTYVNSQWTPPFTQDQIQNCHLVPYLSNLPPPPEYPGPKGPIMTEKPEIRKSHETIDKIELTKSQPDLSRLAEPHQKAHIHAYSSEPKFSSSNTSGESRVEEVDHLAIATRTTQMIEMLSAENRRLREELEINYKKVSKLQRFEFEIEKVHEAYESLVKSSEKRERLEAAMKKRLEDDLRKVKAENAEIREKLDKLIQESHQKSYSSDEATIGKLRAQNKELLSLTRKDAKANYLDPSQRNFTQQQADLEKMNQLQKAFVSLQTDSKRREIKETELRSRLENELDSLRAQQKIGWKRSGDKDGELTNVTVVQRLLNEKDSKILELETELAKCEQRVLEETTMRQLAVEDSVGSKDGRLAALEKSSAETEKLIDEAKSEKLKHMEELYQANRKVAELESKVKSLQTQVSEKEAMLKVLQRSPMTRSSSVHTICCSPLHSPRPSIISTSSLSRQGSQSDCFRDFPTIKHVKAGSASAIESRSVQDDLLEKFRDLQTESKDDTDEEGKMLLWQV